MKRIVIILSAFVLLLFPAFVQSRLADPQKDVTEISGNLVIGGNDVYVMEGDYVVNGSVLVEENGTLVMRNAFVNFTLPADGSFSMTFSNPVGGNPRLVVEENVTIFANRLMTVYFLGNSTAEINQLAVNSNVAFNLNSESSITAANSTFPYMTFFYHYSTGAFHNCSFGGCYLYGNSSVAYENCTLKWLNVMQDASAQVKDSTVANGLTLSMENANCAVDGLKPGLYTLWDFRLECDVEVAMGGHAPHLVMDNAWVETWSFIFLGFSNATFLDFQNGRLTLYGYSCVQASSSYLDTIAAYDNAVFRVNDSTTRWAYLFGSSTVVAVNSSALYPTIQEEAKVYAYYYLFVEVKDLVNVSVPNATVNIYPEGAVVPEFSEVTDDDGKAFFVLFGSIINATGGYSVGPYTVEVVYGEYSQNETVFMYGNVEVTVVLDFVLPEFSVGLLLPLLLVASLILVVVRRKECLFSA